MQTQVKPDTFVYASYIRSTPEKVWAALTQGDFTAQYWFGFRVDVEQKAGGRVRFVPPKGRKAFDHYDGKVLVFDPHRTLSYTWMPECGKGEIAADVSPSRVTFELTPMGAMVKLRVIHDQLHPNEVEQDPTNTFRGINNGWPAVICSLKSLLETGQAMAYDLPS